MNWRSITFCVVVGVCGVSIPSPGFAVDVPMSEDVERRLANTILPTLEKGNTVRCSAKTSVGSSLGGCHQPLTYLRTEAAPRPGEFLVLIWFVHVPTGREIPNFLCENCQASVLVALMESNKDTFTVRAVAPSLVTASGRELWVPTQPIRFGKSTLFSIDKTHRNRGLVRRDRQYWGLRKTALQPAGTVPVYGSNEGVCGRLNDVVQTQKTLGNKGECGTVWRFETAIVVQSKGISVSESLIEVARPKFVRKSTQRDISYVWSNYRFVAKKKTLFPG